MPKKYYFVLASYENEDELIAKAANYYGTKEYMRVNDNLEFIDSIKKLVVHSDSSNNCRLMLIGVCIVAMSYCDSIYITKDWENDDVCKICHAFAFAHGLDIVYES